MTEDGNTFGPRLTALKLAALDCVRRVSGDRVEVRGLAELELRKALELDNGVGKLEAFALMLEVTAGKMRLVAADSLLADDEDDEDGATQRRKHLSLIDDEPDERVPLEGRDCEALAALVVGARSLTREDLKPSDGDDDGAVPLSSFPAVDDDPVRDGEWLKLDRRSLIAAGANPADLEEIIDPFDGREGGEAVDESRLPEKAPPNVCEVRGDAGSSCYAAGVFRLKWGCVICDHCLEEIGQLDRGERSDIRREIPSSPRPPPLSAGTSESFPSGGKPPSYEGKVRGKMREAVDEAVAEAVRFSANVAVVGALNEAPELDGLTPEKKLELAAKVFESSGFPAGLLRERPELIPAPTFVIRDADALSSLQQLLGSPLTLEAMKSDVAELAILFRLARRETGFLCDASGAAVELVILRSPDSLLRQKISELARARGKGGFADALSWFDDVESIAFDLFNEATEEQADA